MLERVMECENRLMQERALLNELMKECSAGNSSEIVRLKMEGLQREINNMNQQLAILKNEYYRQQAWQRQQNQPSLNQAVHPNAAIHANPAGYAMPQLYQPPKKQDMEKTIGKSFMGICASVLIFISLILVATLVVPYLSDAMKMALMFGVSFVFCAAGNLLLMKEKQNKWFLSLTGCGVGAVYLSLMISALYFKAIPDMILYICIFVWAVAVSILSRLRSQIFLVIGQLGIWISVMFGVIYCSVEKDGIRVLLLCVYFLLAEAVFYISHRNREYGKNLLNHLFGLLCLMTLLFVNHIEYGSGRIQGMAASALLTVAACIPIAMGIFFFQVRKQDEWQFGIFNILYFLTASLSFETYFSEYTILLAVPAVLFLTGMEKRFQTEEGGLNAGGLIFQSALFFFLFVEVLHTGFLRQCSTTALPAIICLWYGCSKNRTAYTTAGFIYGIWVLLLPFNGYWYLFWGSVMLAVFAGLAYRYRQQYRTWMKLVVYPLFLLFAVINTGKVLDDLGILFGNAQKLGLLAAAALVNIALMKLPVLHKDLKSGRKEKEFLIEAGIFHGGYMLIALGFISSMEPLGYHLAAIMLGLLLFTVNLTSLWKHLDCGWSSIYAGSKLFVLALVILGSFHAPDYFFSITALLFAIAFIIAGFLAEKKLGRSVKAIRIYGLVLTLLSVVKLLLLDIYYDNIISLAVSFFVSGLLCFAISFVYHLVDKKLAQNG